MLKSDPPLTFGAGQASSSGHAHSSKAYKHRKRSSILKPLSAVTDGWDPDVDEDRLLLFMDPEDFAPNDALSDCSRDSLKQTRTKSEVLRTGRSNISAVIKVCIIISYSSC